MAADKLDTSVFTDDSGGRTRIVGVVLGVAAGLLGLGAAAVQGRPDVAAARSAWDGERGDLQPDKLVFLDETWATTNMTPTRGRSLILICIH